MMEYSHNGIFYLSKMAEVKCICCIIKFLWSLFLRVQFLKCQHFFSILCLVKCAKYRSGPKQIFSFLDSLEIQSLVPIELPCFHFLGCICFTNKYFIRLEPWCRLYQWCMGQMHGTCEPHDRSLLTWCWWRIAWGHTWDDSLFIFPLTC